MIFVGGYMQIRDRFARQVFFPVTAAVSMILAVALVGVGTPPAPTAWRPSPGAPLSFLRPIESFAGATMPAPQCAAGLGRDESVPYRYFETRNYSTCAGKTVWTSYEVKTYCDGSVLILPPGEGECYDPGQATCDYLHYVDWWQSD